MYIFSMHKPCNSGPWVATQQRHYCEVAHERHSMTDDPTLAVLHVKTLHYMLYEGGKK